jgi:hypothetical protein
MTIDIKDDPNLELSLDQLWENYMDAMASWVVAKSRYGRLLNDAIESGDRDWWASPQAKGFEAQMLEANAKARWSLSIYNWKQTALQFEQMQATGQLKFTGK